MTHFVQKMYNYWRIHGSSAFIRRSFNGLRSKLRLSSSHPSSLHHNPHQPYNPYNNSSKNQITSQIPVHLSVPLITYTVQLTQNRRINIITDSINSSSLFGGVGTALILASLLANKLKASLRIITRIEKSIPSNLNSFLSLYGIKLEHEPQFQLAAMNNANYELDVSNADLFITTSWWNTKSILSTIKKDKIIYLLQEDERMFYQYGDERLACETLLKNNDIRFLLNTKLLFDYLVNDGFTNIEKHGKYFEPAFPKQIFYRRVNKNSEKRKFFFYARPRNPRNLFYLGIQVIDRAIMQGVLNLDEWEIFLVGSHIPNIKLSHNYTPIKYENLLWSKYAEFIGSIDLGLSLMYTPHPSYPPLDLVSSGAVVVTNRLANKQDLTNYSQNLICADLDCNSLVDALEKAQKIVKNNTLRMENYANNKLLTTWQTAFSEILNQFN